MLKTLFIALFVVLLAMVAIGFANGWITVQQSDRSTSIEVNTDEINSATKNAVEEGRDALDEMEEKVRRLGESPPSPDALNSVIRGEREPERREQGTVPVASPHTKGADDQAL